MLKKIKKLNDQDNLHINFLDWIIFMVCALGCYLLFAQVDIRITAEHSFKLLEGHIADFYTACYEWNGAYAANYLPSTYIVFALWNLPMKIIGKVPDIWGSSMHLVLWYKLFPICMYFLSGYILEKICIENLKFSSKKARIVLYMFFTTPIAFFSQFIFGQYDIFTVFFMLLGLKYYFDNSKKRNFYLFILYFSIAITFKYYALLIFLILLFIRVKKVLNIIWNCMLVGLPYFFEFGFFIITDTNSFRNAVLGFNAVDFIKNCEISVGSSAIRLLPFALLILFACAYFIKPNDKQEEIKYSLYFCCGICCALFSLMNWYPQWLLFAVPFFVLSIAINKFYDVFLWLDSVLIILIYVYSVNQFVGNVDENMLRNGILAPLLKYREIGTSLTMKDIFGFSDINLLYTAIVAIFLVYFIFKHPKYCSSDIAAEFEEHNLYTQNFSLKNLLRVRFLICILFFIIPATLCIPSMLKQKELLWSRDDTYALNEEYFDLKYGTEIEQTFNVTDSKISEIRLKVYLQDNYLEGSGKISMEIIDKQSDEIIGESNFTKEDLSNNLMIFMFDDLTLKKGEYIIHLKTKNKNTELQISCIETPTNDYQLNAIQQDYVNDILRIDEEVKSGYYLTMDILGNTQ